MVRRRSLLLVGGADEFILNEENIDRARFWQECGPFLPLLKR